MALEEVQSGKIKFEEEGTEVAGVLITAEERSTANGDSMAYEVRGKDGIVFFYGSKILDDKIQKIIDTIGLGAVVKITYTGDEKSQSTGNEYKTFKVLSGEPNSENLEMVGMEPDDGLNEVDEENEDIPFE